MDTIVSSGQTYSGVVATFDTLTVASGGVASGVQVQGGSVTVTSGGVAVGTSVTSAYVSYEFDGPHFIAGGSLTVVSGGVATGTMVGDGSSLTNGGLVSGTTVGALAAFVNSAGSAVNTTVSGRFTVAGGTVSNTTVAKGGIETLSGVDIGAIVSSGGLLIVDGGSASGTSYQGSSVYGLFLPGAVVSGASLVAGNPALTGQFIRATVQGNDGITGGATAGTILQPGTYLDDTALPFTAGATATLDAATDVLTISMGGTTTALQLAGSYAGDTIRLESDRPFGPGANSGTLVEVTSGGQPDGAFGLDKVATVRSGYTYSPTSFDEYSRNTTFDIPLPPPPVTPTDTSGVEAADYVIGVAYALVTAAYPAATTPGIYTTSFSGGQAVYATIDSPGQPINVSATGASYIAAGAAYNTVTVNNGTQTGIATGTGSSDVYLQTGTNQLYSEGHDTVHVGAGSDVIFITGQAVVYGGNAMLFIMADPGAQFTLHTGAGSVIADGRTGFGTFSGGTNGHNQLTGGTGPTTLYAGGDGDQLIAQGGSSTTFYGWGGAETMDGQYSQGLDTFNFDGANVTAHGGAGQNIFNIGTGTNNILAGIGSGLFDFTYGAAGGRTFIAQFNTSTDHLHLAGYAADEVNHALGSATTYQGSEVLHLRDGTSIGFGGVTGLTQASFV